MYVSGYNPHGELFTKDTTNRKYATPVETDKDILTASTTKNVNIQTGAIADINGNVYTVGYNGNGELGNTTTTSSTSSSTTVVANNSVGGTTENDEKNKINIETPNILYEYVDDNENKVAKS